MCPTLQEERIICHEETSSESSVVTPPDCVEEEDEGGCCALFSVFINFFSLYLYMQSLRMCLVKLILKFSFFQRHLTLVFASVSYFFYACLFFISKQTMFDYASSFKENDDENVRNDDENYFVSGKRPSSIIWNCIIGLLIQMYRAQKTRISSEIYLPFECCSEGYPPFG